MKENFHGNSIVLQVAVATNNNMDKCCLFWCRAAQWIYVQSGIILRVFSKFRGISNIAIRKQKICRKYRQLLHRRLSTHLVSIQVLPYAHDLAFQFWLLTLTQHMTLHIVIAFQFYAFFWH